MIEIIERGPEKFITTCQKCGTKFSYELKDLWNNLLTPHVKCPVCEEVCYHHISNVEKKEPETITAPNTYPYPYIYPTYPLYNDLVNRQFSIPTTIASGTSTPYPNSVSSSYTSDNVLKMERTPVSVVK